MEIVVAYIFVPIVYLIPLIIFVLINKHNQFTGSDHNIHNLYVQLIRKNNGSFISSCDNMVNENRMAYPQLLHWVIANFTKDGNNKVASNLLYLNTVISSIVHFVTVLLIFNTLELEMPFHYLLLLAALIFISFPFNFNTSNAKNVGLSARGIGVWLGQLYLTFLILSIFENSVLFFAISSIVALVILMSSTFSAQFMLMVSVLLAIFYLNPIILVPPVTGLLLFIVINRKVASVYLYGQFTHKRNYAKYIAKIFILKHRKSIWLDWGNEIPKRLKWIILDYKKNRKELVYIQGNAIFIILFQMTFMVITTLLIDYKTIVFSNNLMSVLSISILACWTLFFLTSFSITRFLGEPERYLEFAFIFCSILAASINYRLVILICCFNLIYIFWNLSNFIKENKENTKDEFEGLKLKLEELNKEKGVRLLAPRTSIRRKLRSVKYKQFDWVFFNDNIDGLTMSDVFSTDYNDFVGDSWNVLINKYNLNYIVLSFDVLGWINKTENKNLNFSLIEKFGDIHLYEITRSSFG